MSDAIIAETTTIKGHNGDEIEAYFARPVDGNESVRFCFYNVKGAWQRHPLMISTEEGPQIREALASTPRLRAILKDVFG